MTNDAVDKEMLSLLDQAAKLIEQAKSLVGANFSFPSDAAQLVESRVCLVCRKKIPAGQRSFRGAHEACQKRVYRSIQAGNMTDAEAVSAGLLAPVKLGGGGGRITDDKLAEYLSTRHQRSDADAEAIARKFHDKKKELMEESRKKRSAGQKTPAKPRESKPAE